ncbi:MAG: hypothetical protein J1F06_06190 [Prevotellaceae bacterium]|nr:hypothetical protein [Prevotellaceae bacterium]
MQKQQASVFPLSLLPHLIIRKRTQRTNPDVEKKERANGKLKTMVVKLSFKFFGVKTTYTFEAKVSLRVRFRLRGGGREASISVCPIQRSQIEGITVNGKRSEFTAEEYDKLTAALRAVAAKRNEYADATDAA